MNNIALVHQLSHRLCAGQLPRGRIKANHGFLTNGQPAIQFNYTREAMRGKMTRTEEACRGLILDATTGAILALPMRKFYNLGEPSCPTLPDEDYQVFQKIDGSLGIFWHDGTRWRCNARGSFDSGYTSVGLYYWEKGGYPNPSLTYMAEICVDNDEMPRAAYKKEGIYFIAARNRRAGVDLDPIQVFGGDLATSGTIEELLDRRDVIEGTEGWVIRFKGGLRVKIKTTWYLRIFRAIQSLTPKNIREMMMEGNDFLAQLPDDVCPDAVTIQDKIAARLQSKLIRIYDSYSKVAGIPSRKDFAVATLRDYPDIASFLFALRDDRFIEKDVLKRMDLDFI